MPLAWLENQGFRGSWSSVAMAAGALPILICLSGRSILSLSKTTLVGAVCIGVAVSFYSIAFSIEDVVRVMVLFYIAPFWSMLLEARFGRRKLTWRDIFSLLFLLVGILAIHEFNLSFENSSPLGISFALASGLLFAVGAHLAFGSKSSDVVGMSLVLVVAAVAVSLGIAAADGSRMAYRGGLDLEILLIPLLIGSLYVAPVMVGTLKSATILSPTMLTMLLSLEIVSGFISASIFSGQPFGLSHFLSCFCIVLAITLTYRKPAA